MPPAELLARYLVPALAEGNTPHLFWAERKPSRGHDAGGQATYRWRDRTYNVARVLLQHRHKARRIRAVNQCGLPQCVKPEHWSVEPGFLGVVHDAPSFLVMRVGEAWRLSDGDRTLDRDVAFTGRVAPSTDIHVIRALHEPSETVFIAACRPEPVDPASIVPGGVAACEGCLR